MAICGLYVLYKDNIYIFLPSFTFSCSCTPETYGPRCASKFDDCQGGSQTLCEHGTCVDAERDTPNKVRSNIHFIIHQEMPLYKIT